MTGKGLRRNILKIQGFSEDYFKYRLFKDIIDHISMSWFFKG